MNRKLFTITLMALLVLLLSVGGASGQGPEPERQIGPLAAEAQPQGEASIAATVNSRISYQGMLREGGTPVTGERDMTFRLYSNVLCSAQVGSDIVKDDVPVGNGLFSVKLDVDQGDFDGQGLWLRVLVGGTTVVSCEEILPVPYALSLRPGATMVGTAPGQGILYAENGGDAALSKGLHGKSTAGSGVTIGVLGENLSTSGTGVFGWAGAGSGTTYGVQGQSSSTSGIGVRGLAYAGSGTTYGVWGQSDSTSGTGVYGRANAAGGTGVYGRSNNGVGVYARSDSGVGMHSTSISDTAVWAETAGGFAAVDARNTSGYGVYAKSGSGVGVRAVSDSNTAVWAQTFDGIAAVDARNTSGVGVHSTSISNTAVWAETSEGFAAVDARNASGGYGVYAESYSGVGVRAISNSDTAVWAETADGIAAVDARNYGGGHGIYAESAGPGGNGTAVYAQANHANGIAFWGNSNSTDATLVLRNDGTGDLIRGFSHGDWDFRFRVENDGRTTVSVLAITGGSDLSERFDVTADGEITPGLVVCIDANHPGNLLVCNRAYDRTVAGIVSGAGGIEPGMVMGQQGSPADGAYPVALTGRVYVWADASTGPIQPGDLLTTSDTPGYVMRVSDYAQAQGAVIGKAMSSLDQAQGLVLVLVSLQ